MSGPHICVAAARNAVRDTFREAGIGPGDRVLVAVSGGSDSMALAYATLFVAKHEGIFVSSLIVDHAIREESAAEAETVRSWLEQSGASAAVVPVDATAKPGGAGPEGAARTARYDALARAATECGARAVLLGHTSDDQAETVLLGLSRGSGARSLSGMRRVGQLPGFPGIVALRPLLGLRREELRAGLRAEGRQWIDDPTNESDSTWRAFDGSLLRRAGIRHLALPALEEALGPKVIGSLSRTARLLQADDDALEDWAGRERLRLGAEPEIREMKALPRAVRARIIRRLALEAGAQAGELTSWHIEHVDELITGPGGARGVDLPGIRVVQRVGSLHFYSVGLEH